MNFLNDFYVVIKMKIGLITIQDLNNYGNRLQNYAMQEILSDRGFDVYTLYNRPRTSQPNTKLKELIIRIMKVIQEKINSLKIHKRYKNFKKFNKRIKYGGYLSYCNKSRIDAEYDFFVVGSDQIWNPNFNLRGGMISYLSFVDEKRKIAISPSISADYLTNEQLLKMKDFLYNFKKISCREEQGSIILEKMLNQTVVTLIDPTLMLDKTKWEKIIYSPSKLPENKYVLLYTLGRTSLEYFAKIKKYCDSNNFLLINLMDKNNYYFNSGPSEFLYLIKNCECMITDSFHGCIFSYIFGKKLRVFNRQTSGVSMNSRIKNLIKVLNLDEDVLYCDDFEIENEYDYQFLKKEQEKFKKFIDNCLE